jgi:type II secretory pathway pseudopilin PulG
MLARRPHRRRRTLRAFTLVEMLVAMVLTLIMVWAIAEFYARVGEAVRDGRAMIDQRSGLRTATQRLTDDLRLPTVVPAPPAQDETTPIPGIGLLLGVQGPGYLEIFEGLGSDADPDGNGIDILPPPGGNGIPDIADDLNPANGIPDMVEGMIPGLLGDVDDYLGLTIRTDAEPFVAPVILLNPNTGIMSGTGSGASNVAEVAWWTSFKDDPLFAGSPGTWELAETRSLHRRMLLVRPDLNQTHPSDSDYAGPYYFRIASNSVAEAYYSVLQLGDVSVRPFGPINGNGYVYFMANSLADLTRRENRFLHVPGAAAFPNPLDLNPNKYGDPLQPLRSASPNNDFSQYRWVLAGARRGEDVILSNVLAFDVRVFDALAALRADNVVAANAIGTVQPGDPGYSMTIANGHAVAGAGAYVDLNYSRYLTAPLPTASAFSGPGLQTGLTGTYDTWAASYERDGLNQNGNGLTDEGTDGLDNDGANGVDDKGEHETTPPYPTRLRGLEVKVRTYEPGTRQVQQGTVGADFIPE